MTGTDPESHLEVGQRPIEPRIYVASLSDYNAGRLHGEWVDAAQDIDDLHLAVQAILRRSREPVAEEWAIHDYEGFAPLELFEHTPLPFVAQIACGIVEHGPAYAAWAKITDPAGWDDDLDRFDEAYLGEWATRAEYAEQLVEDMGIDLEAIGPPMLQPYISVDLDAFARDLAGGVDFVAAPNGGIYAFQPR